MGTWPLGMTNPFTKWDEFWIFLQKTPDLDFARYIANVFQYTTNTPNFFLEDYQNKK